MCSLSLLWPPPPSDSSSSSSSSASSSSTVAPPPAAARSEVPLWSEEEYDVILYAAFNQDLSCLCVGTTTGFRLFETQPFTIIHARELGGGVSIVEMDGRSNRLVLVGGGPVPAFPPHKVVVWDEEQARVLYDIDVQSRVLAVRIVKDCLFFSVADCLYMFQLSDGRLLRRWENFAHEQGLFAVAYRDFCVCACAGRDTGVVLVSSGCEQPTLSSEPPLAIKAHKSKVVAMALTGDGAKLATCSESGSLIRIFDTNTGKQIQELRRGAEDARMFSLSFSVDSTLLCCLASTGTLHLFTMKMTDQEQRRRDDGAAVAVKTRPPNVTGRLKPLGFVLNYFASEWSWARSSEFPSRGIALFCRGSDDIMVICVDGRYHRMRFDPDGRNDVIEEVENRSFTVLPE